VPNFLQQIQQRMQQMAAEQQAAVQNTMDDMEVAVENAGFTFESMAPAFTINLPKLSDTVLNLDFPVPVFLEGDNPDLPACKFVYNFYDPQESVDETGQSAVPGRDLSAKPRYIQLFFKLPATTDVQAINFSEIDLANDEIDNSGNTPTVKPELINNETSAQTAPRFLNIGLQDLNIEGKMRDLVTTSAKKKIAEENAKIAKEIDAVKQNFFSRAAQSQSDLVRVLRRQLQGNRPSDDFLSDAINNINELNESYINDEEAATVAQNNFNLAKRAKFDASLNAKFVASLVNTSITDPIGTYTEEFIPLQTLVEKIQSDAISNYLAQDQALGDLSIMFIENTLHVGQQPDKALNSVEFKFAGFVLEKTEVKSDGSIVLIDRRVINPSAIRVNSVTELLDEKVAYGRNYVYQISALLLGSVLEPNVVPPAGENTAVRGQGTTDCLRRFFFVQSNKSKALSIRTVETVPPRPPVNLKVAWHQPDKGSLLTWNHPANPQKDIKRFQVFRRASIQEGFTLLAEYDFDYSEILYSSGEQVEPHIKIKVPKPVYHFIDKNIDLDKNYIYAVRSIDAHGLASGYSMQISCRYNKFTNKIDSRLLSPQGTVTGTPVQYPNFFLEQGKFVDTIKDSGHSRLKIYFDPEYLRLYKKSGPQGESREDLKLFNFEGRGNGINGTANFQLQMLNTDLQQSQTVDIIIADDRRD
jgi:hypothetical protein